MRQNSQRNWENFLVVKDYLQINIDDKKPQSLAALLPGGWLFSIMNIL